MLLESFSKEVDPCLVNSADYAFAVGIFHVDDALEINYQEELGTWQCSSVSLLFTQE